MNKLIQKLIYSNYDEYGEDYQGLILLIFGASSYKDDKDVKAVLKSRSCNWIFDAQMIRDKCNAFLDPSYYEDITIEI